VTSLAVALRCGNCEDVRRRDSEARARERENACDSAHRRAEPQTSVDFIGFVKTVWAYIQLFDWPLVDSVLFSSCLVAHFLCVLERLDAIKAPECLFCNLPTPAQPPPASSQNPCASTTLW